MGTPLAVACSPRDTWDLDARLLVATVITKGDRVSRHLAAHVTATSSSRSWQAALAGEGKLASAARPAAQAPPSRRGAGPGAPALKNVVVPPRLQELLSALPVLPYEASQRV